MSDLLFICFSCKKELLKKFASERSGGPLCPKCHLESNHESMQRILDDMKRDLDNEEFPVSDLFMRIMDEHLDFFVEEKRWFDGCYKKKYE
jgi:hypothetical protein